MPSGGLPRVCGLESCSCIGGDDDFVSGRGPDLWLSVLVSVGRQGKYLSVGPTFFRPGGAGVGGVVGGSVGCDSDGFQGIGEGRELDDRSRVTGFQIAPLVVERWIPWGVLASTAWVSGCPASAAGVNPAVAVSHVVPSGLVRSCPSNATIPDFVVVMAWKSESPCRERCSQV